MTTADTDTEASRAHSELEVSLGGDAQTRLKSKWVRVQPKKILMLEMGSTGYNVQKSTKTKNQTTPKTIQVGRHKWHKTDKHG